MKVFFRNITMKKILQVNLSAGGPMVLMENIYRVLYPKEIRFDVASLSPFVYESDVEFFNRYGSKLYFGNTSMNKISLQFEKYKFVKRILKNDHYDCIHIHVDDAYNCLVYGLAAKSAGMSKIIFHSHSTGMIVDNRSKRILHSVSRYLLKFVGTDFLACSYPAGQFMFPNVMNDNVTILKNGIDLNVFKLEPKKREEFRKKLGLLDSDVVIGHVGRFSHEKNHEFIIKLLSELKKSSNRYKLLLVGDGDNRKAIEDLASNLKVLNSIIFAGNVDNVYDYLQAMDLFVFPSKFEGLGIAGVEAQACGLPVIASNKVPKEMKLTDNVSFLPVDDVSNWVDTVKKMIILPKSPNSDRIRSAGYDIDETAKIVREMYLR